MKLEYICRTKETLSGELVLDNDSVRLQCHATDWEFKPGEEYKVTIQKL